jgi:enolase-phosphatase E1
MSLVENIRKTESIILGNNQVDESSLVQLWRSQVAVLRSEIAKHSSSNVGIILDIEGTITPLYFVTKILFPFFLKKCESFVKLHLSQKIFHLASSSAAKINLENEMSSPLEKSMVEVASEFIEYFYRSNSKNEKNDDESETLPSSLEQFQNDLVQDSLAHTVANRKIPYMKKLQGMCWHQAYLDGSIVGDLFSDVVPFSRASVFDSRHHQQKKQQKVHIYSSGSIFAQKLLLGYSQFGNLVEDVSKFNIREYHDTVTAGMKGEALSYQKIYDKIVDDDDHHQEEVEEKESSLLCIFVSDSLMELRAARESTKSATPKGRVCRFVPVLAIRPQNPVVGNEEDVEFSSIFTMAQLSEALRNVEEFQPDLILKEVIQVKQDVAKYSVTENEERKIF